MSWFLYALITVLAWGGADLFYKKGAAAEEKYSHLRTAVMVGLVMGAHAVYTLLFGDIGYDPVNLILYLPVSLMYIFSMVIGYFGLRYLELSISSPVQNASGGVVCVLCVVFLGARPALASTLAVAAICAGLVALGVMQNRRDRLEAAGDREHMSGFRAFLFPLAYCVIDALGTFFDAYYLDSIETTPLAGVTEDTLEAVANTSYELTFLLIALLLMVWLRFVKKQPMEWPRQGNRLTAALLETAGQFTYVYAMSGNGAVAAPMVAGYSVVSMLLGRVLLREKLTKAQYAAIAAVMAGIAVLGALEG